MYRFFTFIVFITFLFSCSSDTKKDNTEDDSIIYSKNQEMELSVIPLLNNKNVKLGIYYPFIDKDSIVINRLDFYLSNFQFNRRNFNLFSVYLYQLGITNAPIKVKNDSLPLRIDSVRYMVGLDSLVNESDPNYYPLSSPLSSNNNMYWNAWTKYRYVVFEGVVKGADGTLYPFSYHMGFNFRSKFTISKQINPNIDYKYSNRLILNIDKIFSPTSNPKIDYKAGELHAHSEPTDLILSSKFSKNFNEAFTFE